MTIITEDLTANIKNTSLALGFFDGIHKGHQKVLTDALKLSKELGTKSVVLTFKNHPVEVLYDVIPEFITTYEERIEIFKQMGFDAVIMADFTKDIAHMPADEYFRKIILNFEPKSISLGYNHKFGANQSGDCDFLENISRRYDFILSVAEPVKNKNEITSSTLIRNSIKDGDVQKASRLLGSPYKVKNVVIHGAKRGRELNFPTANLMFPDKKIVPKFGVYAGCAIVNGKTFDAIANVGLRPTFGDIQVPLLEVHILKFNADIYGKVLEFEFLRKIRDEIKFTNVDKLKEQILRDIDSF